MIARFNRRAVSRDLSAAGLLLAIAATGDSAPRCYIVGRFQLVGQQHLRWSNGPHLAADHFSPATHLERCRDILQHSARRLPPSHCEGASLHRRLHEASVYDGSHHQSGRLSEHTG